MKPNDLYPSIADYNEELICMELAKGDVMYYKSIFDCWDFAEVVEISTLRLINEFKDGE